MHGSATLSVHAGQCNTVCISVWYTVSACVAVNAWQSMILISAFMTVHFSVSIISWFAISKLGNAACSASESQGHMTAELASQVNFISRHSLACILNRPAPSRSTAYNSTVELCLAFSLASSTAGMCTAVPGSLLQLSVFMQAAFCVSPYLDEFPRQISGSTCTHCRAALPCAFMQVVFCV